MSPTRITRLSSTEVANISALPIERRREELLCVERPNVFWGYTPVENALPKLLLAASPLFGHLPPGDDNELLRSIVKACKSGPIQAKACSAVAKAIVDWRNRHGVTGRIVHTSPLRTSVDSLRYCADVVAILDETVFVIYLDPRSAMKLTVEGREFIKSLIHHTALIGDLRYAKPAILRTPKTTGSSRQVKFEPLVGEPSFSLDEIVRRVTETYAIWELIRRARSVDSEAEEN